MLVLLRNACSYLAGSPTRGFAAGGPLRRVELFQNGRGFYYILSDTTAIGLNMV